MIIKFVIDSGKMIKGLSDTGEHHLCDRFFYVHRYAVEIIRLGCLYGYQ